MVPSQSSYQHGPPLLGRVRVPSRSPTSSLVRSPPTPSSTSASTTVFPCLWPTSAWALFLGRPPVYPQTCGASETSGPASPQWPDVPRMNEGLPGYRAVFFRTCHGQTPRRVRCPLAHSQETSLLAFGVHDPLGTRNERCFVADVHGPHARVPTLRPTPLPGTAQGSLPAGRAHPWPDGIRTR